MFNKRTWCFAALLCVSAAPALAAGFEGSYFGVNLGGYMATTDNDHSLNKPLVGGSSVTHANTIAGVAALSTSADQSGVLGGIHGGYNWRFGSFVVGAEADLGYWGYSTTASRTSTFPIGNTDRTVTTTNTAEANYLVTLRPRLGFALSDRSLIHVSAGIAYADLEYSNTSRISVNPIPVPSGYISYQSSASSNLGWIFGAGYEHAWTDRMSLRIDYQYIDFGRTTSTGAADPNTVDLQGSSLAVGYETKVQVLRLGVNWRF